MADQNLYAAYGGSVATDTAPAADPTEQHSFRTGIGAAPSTSAQTESNNPTGSVANDPYASYGGSIAAQSEQAQPSGTIISNRADELAAKGLSAAGLPTSIADIPNWFQHFIGVAKDSRPVWDAFKKAVENPTQENIVGAVPIVGPASVAMSKDVQKGDYLGAGATLAGTLAIPKVVETGGAVAKAGVQAVGKAASAAGETAGKVGEAISESKIVDLLKKRPETPTPQHGTPVRVESPLDSATVGRQLGGKDLSQEALNTLQKHVGDKIPVGGSAKNTLMKSVEPVSKAIADASSKMNDIVSKAPDMKTSVFDDGKIATDINDIKKTFPASVKKALSEDVDGVMEDADTALKSRNPQEVLEYRRTLGKQIDWDNIAKNPSTPNEAQNLARVKVYKALGDKIHAEIPETAALDKTLQPNLELRSHMRTKLGDRVVDDPHAATVESQTEFKKGQTAIENAAHNAQVEKYWSAIKVGLAAAGGTFGLKELRQLLGL